MNAFTFKTLLLSCFFLSACVFDPSFMSQPGPHRGEQDSCGFTVDEYSGEGLRWKKSKFPVVFKVHANVPRDARRNFISAVNHWNMAWYDFLEKKALEPFDLFYVDMRGVYEGDTAADGSNLFLFIHEGFSRYEDQNAQAITALRSDRINSSIIDTDILVNSVNFNFYYDSSYNKVIDLAMQGFEKKRQLASLKSPGRYVQVIEKIKSFFSFFLKLFKKEKPIRQIADYKPDIPKSKVDFPSLMVHELGHVPGRGHYDEDEFHSHASRRNLKSKESQSKNNRNDYKSVMEPFLQQGRARREITKYDLENLFCAYYNY